MIALALGIMSAVYCYRSNYVLSTIIFALFSLSIIIPVLVLIKRKLLKKKVLFLVAFAVLFGIGFLSAFTCVVNYDKADLNNHYFDVSGRITEIKDTEYGNASVVSNVTLKGYNSGKVPYKIALYVVGTCSVDLGDEVTFTAQLTDRKSVYDERFSAEMIVQGIKYNATVSATELTVCSHSPTIFERANLFVRDTLKKGMNGDEFAVGYALLTGNSDFMREETLNGFRYAGISHIFAVSGLHIGFFALALGFLLKKLRCNKLVSAIIITVGCFLYSGVCGFTASSLRATITCSVAYFASVWGEKYDGLSTLGVAGVIILLFRPLELFCVGFKLSFIAVAGILILSTPISRIFKFFPRKIRNGLASVLSAQIVSIPILLDSFGYFSIVSLIANLLLLPIVCFIFIFLLCCVILAGITTLTTPILFLPKICLRCVNVCVNAFDYRVFLVSGISFGAVAVFYYACALTSCGFLNFRLKPRIIISLALALTCAVSAVSYNLILLKTPSVYVVASNNFGATAVKSEKGNILFVSELGAFFTSSRLEKLSSVSKTSHIDNLVVLNGYGNADVQNVTAKILRVFSVDYVYYYDDNDTMQKIMKASFPSVESAYFSDNTIIPTAYGKCRFIAGGYGVEFITERNSFAFFGKFGGNVDYGRSENAYDYAVASDWVERVNSIYKPKTMISYHSSQYANGEERGIISLK